MRKRPGRIRRTASFVANAIPTIHDGVRGVWQSEAGRKWLVPLMVFLCVTGLFLILAASVEALAPFVYAIF
jgi:hypothetical protein